MALIRDNAKEKIRQFYWLAVLWILFILVAPVSLFGKEADKESKEELKAKSDFVLTIRDNLISLDAKDASLAEVVEEIGSRMGIDVITKIPEGKRVTTKFNKLSIEGAIERFRRYADIVYIKDSEEAKITKIMVFPKGKGENLYKSEVSAGEESIEEAPQVEAEEEEVGEEEPQRPEPFKFEFDPSEFEEE